MSAHVAPHGSWSRYTYHGCRCKVCVRGAVRIDAQRTLERMSGRPRSVPAKNVVPHIQRLMASGMTAQQVAREAGVDPSAIRWSLSGQKKTLLRRTADRILGVKVGTQVTVGMVPAVGATRRIQALYALGHFNRQIAEATGLSRDFVIDLANGDRSSLSAQRDAAVRRVYDELSMTVGSSPKTRLYAASKGWVPPLAWDDDTIDDPQAVPTLDAPMPEPVESGEQAVARFLMGESVVLAPADRREVIRHLMEWTELTPEEIAARVESTPKAVSRAWERIKREAREAGRPAPWRRRVENSRAQARRRQLEVAA